MSENVKKMRTVFMGSSIFASTILEAMLKQEYDIISVYTHPGKKSGRNGTGEIIRSEVEELAKKKKLNLFQPDNFDKAELDKLASQKPDLIIVSAYGKILPKELLAIPKFGALNVHGSILPKFRGPSPVQNAILSGEKTTGATIMLMNEGIDTGKIIKQKKIDIEGDETFPLVLARLADTSAELLLETIPLWVEDKIEAKDQNEEEATLCQLIERSDGKIIWAEDAEEIYNKYRAFLPWPGIFTFWEKEKNNIRLKLNKISVLRNNPASSHRIGEVFEIGDKIGVQTNRGVVFLEEVQAEGKNNVKIADFLNGNPGFLGSVLK